VFADQRNLATLQVDGQVNAFLDNAIVNKDLKHDDNIE